MSAVRTAVKVAAFPAGIMANREHSDVVVLLYHRIGTGSSQIETSPTSFDRQMAWLGGTGRVRSLDQVLRGSGGVVVSFDDGTRDFVETAMPILIHHGIPAALYLATGEVGGAGPSWAALRDAVATDLITIGSHTHDHVDLSRAEPKSAYAQMRLSKELIERHLGVACRDFAYPFAVGSSAAEAIARRLFRSSVVDAWRTNRRPFDPHRIGRVPILRDDGFAFFRAKARGRLDAEGVAYRVARRGPWRSG